MAKFQKLIYNARMWGNTSPHFTWMALSNGKIESCGHENPPVDSADECFDMKQQWLFPGFHDCHLHISCCGMLFNKKKFLNFPKSVSEFKDNLATLVGDNADTDDWICGFGWDDEMMGAMPSRSDIDEVVSQRPVILYRVCMHIAVVNTRALALAGIKDSDAEYDKFPSGHRNCGTLSGVLKEFEQFDRVQKIIPVQTSEQTKTDILASLDACMKLGITTVHPQDEGCWRYYFELAKENRLPINCIHAPLFSDMGTDHFPPSKEVHDDLARLKCNAVKIFVDGALRVETAALSVPYVNTAQKDNYGMFQASTEKLKTLLNKITKLGYRLEIHVIGDKAAEVALDCLEECDVPPLMRPIFVHCQILRMDLVKRMAKRGVVASVQPSFVATDYEFVQEHLPQELRLCIYPWKTLLENGVAVGGSSDAPVESLSPLEGMYDAIFRLSKTGKVFCEEERLTFAQAVGLYTTGAAFVDCVEESKGQLKPGFDADFVVLDVPLDESGSPSDISAHPRLLKDAKVSQVFVGGNLSWEDT